jgi:trafficking protein particle complex subunit 13
MSTLNRRGASNVMMPPPTAPADETAVPTLRVMRLQSPEIHTSRTAAAAATDSSGTGFALQRSLCLPDSLTVYVGESFTAYLGILNASTTVPIRKLTIQSQLQTPAQRYPLPCRLDAGNLAGGVEIPPGQQMDAIVTRQIEEPGQHILRVEVGYRTADGGTKTFRKFYRFSVQLPLKITTNSVRLGDSRNLVCVNVDYSQEHTILLASVEFDAAPGLLATKVTTKGRSASSPTLTAVELLDTTIDTMSKGGSVRYLFDVSASSKEAILRGIASGDYLGRAVIVWRKAMGETGTIYSHAVHCQPVPNPGVLYKTGWTVDIAAAAATARTSSASLPLPVTVEPIDPDTALVLHVPTTVQFLVVNHSPNSMTLQLQMRSTRSMAIAGSVFTNLGEIAGNGGSIVTSVKLMALSTGLLRVENCIVVELVSGREMVQPPLYNVMERIFPNRSLIHRNALIRRRQERIVAAACIVP